MAILTDQIMKLCFKNNISQNIVEFFCRLSIVFNSVIEVRFQTRQGSLYPFICMQSFLMILQRNYDFFILGSMIVFTYALYYKNLQSCRVHVIM